MSNKTKWRSIAALAVMGIAGCADFQLPQLPPPPSTVSGIGTGVQQKLNVTSVGGLVRALTIAVPANTCNAAAYGSSFRQSYISTWNNAIDLRAQSASAASGSKLAAAKLAPPPAEPVAVGQTPAQGICEQNSRVAGRGDGYAYAHNDFLASPLAQ